MTEAERGVFGAIVGAEKVAKMDGIIDSLISLHDRKVIEDSQEDTA